MANSVIKETKMPLFITYLVIVAKYVILISLHTRSSIIKTIRYSEISESY